jgi:hypothetical protein
MMILRRFLAANDNTDDAVEEEPLTFFQAFVAEFRALLHAGRTLWAAICTRVMACITCARFVLLYSYETLVDRVCTLVAPAYAANRRWDRFPFAVRRNNGRVITLAMQKAYRRGVADARRHGLPLPPYTYEACEDLMARHFEEDEAEIWERSAASRVLAAVLHSEPLPIQHELLEIDDDD